MKQRLQKILISLFTCGLFMASAISTANTNTRTNANAEAPGTAEPLHRDDGFIFGTQNYPVTLCGHASSVTKDKEDNRFLLKNGSLVISLQIGLDADPYSRQQFLDLKGIFPSSADGCVHGRHLPVTTNGITVFEVERTSLAIVLGGISVSN